MMLFEREDEVEHQDLDRCAGRFMVMPADAGGRRPSPAHSWLGLSPRDMVVDLGGWPSRSGNRPPAHQGSGHATRSRESNRLNTRLRELHDEGHAGQQPQPQDHGEADTEAGAPRDR